MKKSSLITIAALSGLICISSVYSYGAEPVNGSAKEVSLSNRDISVIKVLLEEIDAAAKSGDEQLVAKLLASALQSNPQIASRIVESFIDSQSATPKNPATINVTAIMNQVVTHFQQQQGNEALVAAVLSSYTPAAGQKDDDKSNQQGQGAKDKDDSGAKQDNQEAKDKDDAKPKLPPSLPAPGKGNDDRDGDNKLPRENPHQTSPH